MTDEYFTKVQALNNGLEEEICRQMEKEKSSPEQTGNPNTSKDPETKDDPTSRAACAMIVGGLDPDIVAILKDVEKSIAHFIDDVCKSVLSHIGANELLSYLRHIFLSSLNFQTSMWQMVLTESVFLVSANREHLWQEASMLHMFAGLLPEIGPCAIPPQPLPTVQPMQVPAGSNTSAAPTTKPSEGVSITIHNSPSGSSRQDPSTPASMAAQAPFTTTLTPQVLTPGASVPDLSAFDIAECLKVVTCLILGYKTPVEAMQAYSNTPTDGDKLTPKAIARVQLASVPASHPVSGTSSYADKQSSLDFLHNITSSEGKSVVCSHPSSGKLSNSYHEPKRIRLEG